MRFLRHVGDFFSVLLSAFGRSISVLLCDLEARENLFNAGIRRSPESKSFVLQL